jgi:hypothetical protein
MLLADTDTVTAGRVFNARLRWRRGSWRKRLQSVREQMVWRSAVGSQAGSYSWKRVGEPQCCQSTNHGDNVTTFSRASMEVLWEHSVMVGPRDQGTATVTVTNTITMVVTTLVNWLAVTTIAVTSHHRLEGKCGHKAILHQPADGRRT